MTMMFDHRFEPGIQNQILEVLGGRYLGSGVARKVFTLRDDADKVIKIEEKGGSFQNIIEWETWHSVKGTRWERWFAPCFRISASGAVLIQARTTPIERLPRYLPEFLTDIKPSNFGTIGNRVVIHDYGTSVLIERGLGGKLEKIPTSWRSRASWE